MSVIVFDSNKKFIKVTAPGPQGPQGAPAPNVLIQFSPDNANWHTDYQQGDAYVRFSNDNGVTWTNGVPVAVNADTLDGYHASDFQAMIDKKVDEFIIPKNGDTVVWHKVGELTTDIGSKRNNLTLLVSGVSDLGWNKPGVDVVQVSTRRGVSVDVYSLTTPGFRSQTYGYVNNTSTGKTEIWVKRDTYTYDTHFAVLNVYDGFGGAAYGNLASSSTEPSGIVYVDIKTHWTSGNDGSGSGLDADTLDGFDASQTPAANTIPVADANGKIDNWTKPWVANDSRAKVALNANNAPPIYACRAWVNFNGTTSPITIRAGGNVSSITDLGSAHYAVNFATPMPDSNYSVAGLCSILYGNGTGFVTILDVSTSSVKIHLYHDDGSANTGDASVVCVSIFR